MTRIVHEKNRPGFVMKEGDATSDQIAFFAQEYMRMTAGNWCVGVVEGDYWLEAVPLRTVAVQTLTVSVRHVWVSDGVFAARIEKARGGAA